MSKQLLLILTLVCGTLFATASSVVAQDLRPEDTFFIKPRIGISNYMGDNEKSPFNFNGDAYEAGFPLSIALELGYQFSVLNYLWLVFLRFCNDGWYCYFARRKRCLV